MTQLFATKTQHTNDQTSSVTTNISLFQSHSQKHTPKHTMNTLWQTLTGSQPTPNEYNNIEFWTNPERTGFLTKQGEYIKTWRRRYFVLKQGHIFWFKESTVTRGSNPRGVIPVGSCLTVKGAEDVIHKEYAFELSTKNETMYFIADSEKEKEDWINSIGRAIVQCSRSVVHGNEVLDYDHTSIKSSSSSS